MSPAAPVRGGVSVSAGVSPVELVGGRGRPLAHMTVAMANCPPASQPLCGGARGGLALASWHSLPQRPGTFARRRASRKDATHRSGPPRCAHLHRVAASGLRGAGLFSMRLRLLCHRGRITRRAPQCAHSVAGHPQLLAAVIRLFPAIQQAMSHKGAHSKLGSSPWA